MDTKFDSGAPMPGPTMASSSKEPKPKLKASARERLPFTGHLLTDLPLELLKQIVKCTLA